MSFNFRRITPIAASSAMTLLSAHAGAVTPVQAEPIPAMCGNEPMPAIEAPYKMVCALDQGVVADSSHDQGNNIRAALTRLVDSETGLYFPQGRYLVTGNLALRTGNVLVGSASGVTHFINTAAQTSAITHTLHSANNILVEGLVLDNIAIRLFHRGTSVIRYNGLRGVTSDQAQISTVGADRIIGNVLWRDAGGPGVGISAFRGANAQISGNLLGSDALDPSKLFGRLAGPDKRTQRLAQLMTRLAAGNGTVPVAGQSLGHFTTALAVRGSASTRIFENAIAVTGTPLGATGQERRVAALLDVTGLQLERNRFVAQGDEATAPVPLVIRAPQNTEVSRNMFVRVPLRVVPGDGPTPRPTKLTLVKKNYLDAAAIDVTQPVTGDDPTSTTIDDLNFASNLFRTMDPTQCLIDAPIPSQPGRTFAAIGNLRLPGNLPAKTCNLRERTAPQSPAEQRPATPDRVADVKTPLTPLAPTVKPPAADGGLPPAEVPAEKPKKKKWWKRLLDKLF